jgi:aldehyde:ferredoxin oxidoreductase
MAGLDAIVVSGRAERPVYLWVHDGQAEIRDAAHLWGREPEEVQGTIRRDLDDKMIRVLQIGLGGENLVRYAALTNELRHYNGRTGMGAVMGSKNLKAIAVRGTGRYLDYAHDPQTLAELGRNIAKRVKEHPQSWDLQVKGTPALVSGLNAAGILPTRNFRQGAFEQVDKIRWEAYEKELLTARRSCYACAVRCKREVAVNDRYQVSGAYGGPEYEGLAGFSSNCGIDDLQAVAKANELCARYTLDVISASMCVAFAMECFEHKLIGLQETGEVELRFGNAEAMLKMVEMIAHRQGLGNLLADGVRRAAEVIGGDAHYLHYVKGMGRRATAWQGERGYGVSDQQAGADHLVAFHDTLLQNPASLTYQGAIPLGIAEPLPARELSSKKSVMYALMENWSSLEKVIGFCYFGPAPRSFIQVDEVVSAVRAATGWPVTVQDHCASAAGDQPGACVQRRKDSRARTMCCLTVCLLHWKMACWCCSPDFQQAMTDLYVARGRIRRPQCRPRAIESIGRRMGGRLDGPCVRLHLGGHLSWYDPQKRSWLELHLSEPIPR